MTETDLIAREDLAEAFLRRPLGRHGPELQALLNVVRDEPLAGKHVLLCTRPHQRTRYRRAPAGENAMTPAQPLPDDLPLEEAERHVFRLRWKRLTGRDLP